ncbi:hypothetical protein DY000_02024409 [Brassica cretica]|uniref:Uncharacterized protein n=1 Tax=Brassica cretica TaxID=69181 RepID=A0ABQ7E7C6_BRACR|nr:hypothetical protein DY000_02024409 [Brassica cretica]
MAMKHAQPSGKSLVERCDLREREHRRRERELMIVDMILLDEKSTLIQGTIHASRLRRHLSEGSVYSLSGFEVTRSNNNFPLSDSPVSIRFNDRTSFAETTNSKKDIPTELFRFRSHEQL